jgi:serine/threonine protein kinase
MRADSSRWTQVTPSGFAWERAALDWVRSKLPDAEPWRAWSNFELVDDHGVAEVDLLVLSPAGLWVIEIKSRPGRLSGDSHTWRWRRPDGSVFADDNPLIGCDRKAKRLKSLVVRTRAVSGPLPYFTPLVLLDSNELEIDLAPAARFGVVAPDGPADSANPGRLLPRGDGIAGLMQTLFGVDAAGPRSRTPIDAVMAAQLTRALQRAGVRPSNRARRVGSYELTSRPAGDGPGWQDFEARHLYVEKVRRRVRVWSVEGAGSEDERQTRRRAAEREFKALEGIRHPGILEVVDYVPDAERGPAVVFEHPAGAQRLDLWLAEHADRLDLATRLAVLRDIADALRHAHQRRLHHRGLTPRCVLVSQDPGRPPSVKVGDWQTADRQGTSRGTASGPVVTGTAHVADLVDPGTGGYLAPEAWTNSEADGVPLDVFSLGTIGYLLLTGEAPADSPAELAARLLADDGLLLSSRLDGVPERLENAIRGATHREVGLRVQSVDELLEELASAEAELTAPHGPAIVDPLDASPGDQLEEGWEVARPLGRGSSARALLARRDGSEAVLKVALSAEHDERLSAEYDALERLGHPAIVRARARTVLSGHTTVVLDLAGTQTLATKLREDGRIGLDLLERFGTDLLEALRELETKGIAHRDVKPDNLGVAPRGTNDELHLVLFDFSLTRTAPEAIRAGTPPYREPFLVSRAHPAWDVAAERWAATVTLYEMATGTVPVFGDGRSDPAMIDDEATIDADLLDPAVAAPLEAFFTTALSRDPQLRYRSAGEMLRAWQRAFAALDETPVATAGAAEDGRSEPTGRRRSERAIVVPAHITPASRLAEAGSTSRLLSAAGQLGATTVAELIEVSPPAINRLRSVPHQSRRRLLAWRRALAERFAPPEVEVAGDVVGGRSVDALAARLLPRGNAERAEETTGLRVLLGLDAMPGDPLRSPEQWPDFGEVASATGWSRAQVGQHLDAAKRRWTKNTPTITEVRNEIAELLAVHGGVMTAAELADAILALRGSEHSGDARSRVAAAVVRAAVETEHAVTQPRWELRRLGTRVVIVYRAPDRDIDATVSWVAALGAKADALGEEESRLSGAGLTEALRGVLPDAVSGSLPDARVASLAAAASERTALSARLELYPRGMEAAGRCGGHRGRCSAPTPSASRRCNAGYAAASPRPRRCPTARYSTSFSAPPGSRSVGTRPNVSTGCPGRPGRGSARPPR